MKNDWRKKAGIMHFVCVCGC